MRFYLETSEWTYGPKFERTIQSVPSNIVLTSCPIAPIFLYRVVLVELELIEGFPKIWGTQIIWNTWRRYTTHVSFNLHNAHYYFSCTGRLFCVQKTCIFTTLTIYTSLHMNSSIL